MSAVEARRRPGAWLLALVAASLLACDGLFVDPSPGAAGGASLAVSFSLSGAAASAAAGGPAEAFDAVDEIRVRVVRSSDGTVLTDGAIGFTRNAGAAELEPVDVPLEAEDVELLVDIELLWQGLSLFVGSGQTSLSPGQSEDVELTVDAVANRIEISPIPAFASLGETHRLSAAVAFATGDAIPGLGVSWRSSDPAVVAVTQDGLLRVVGEGQAQIIATHGSLTASTTVVIAVAVASVVIEPDEVAIPLGTSFPLVGTAFDGNGTPLVRALSWSSSDPSRANVDQTGLVTGVGVGTAQITAATAGQSATSRVTVTSDPPGVVTGPAGDILPDALTLTGTVNPNGLPTEAWFEWSPNASLSGSRTTARQDVSPTQPGTVVSARLTGLDEGTRYYYRLVAENQIGRTNGSVLSATTLTPLEILTETLPTGVLNRSYTAQLAAVGGMGSYAWSLTAGSLPPGLSLSPTGAITGIPTDSGTYSFTVRVVSGSLSAARSLEIRVLESLAILTTSLPDGLLGVNYSAVLVAEGGDGTYRWSAPDGGLPPGLGVSSSGIISGVPLEGGLYAFTVRVESGGQSATANLSIRIAVPTGLISGVVRVAGTAELPGVPVTLSGPVNRNTTTNFVGGYAFANLPDGTYTVAIVPPSGTTFDVTSQQATIVGGDSVGVSFSGEYISTSSIRGRVTDGTGAPLAGVGVFLNGPVLSETVTNANGEYSFTQLRSGTYTVSIQPPAGFDFPITQRSVTLGVGETRVVDFSAAGPPTISNGTWSLSQANSESCRAILNPPEPLGSAFGLRVSYQDPDGDVRSGAVVISVSYSFSAGGGGSWTAPPDGTPSVSGDGFSGTVSFPACFRFGSSNWVDVTVRLTDSRGNQSNSTVIRINRQAGWNAPFEDEQPALPEVIEAGGGLAEVPVPSR